MAARSSLAQSLPLVAVAVAGRQLHAWLGCKDRSRSTSSRRREVSACQVDHGWTDGTAGRPGAAASADAACRPGHDAVQYWAERNLPSVGRGRPGAACMDDDDGLGWPGVGIGWRVWHDSLRAPVRRGYAAMMRFAMFAAPPLAAVCHCIFALAIFGVSAPPPPAAR